MNATEFKISREYIDALLETNDHTKRGEILDAIKEVAYTRGCPMPAEVEKHLREFAILPSLQMLLMGMYNGDGMAINISEAMIKMDIEAGMQKDIDEHPERYDLDELLKGDAHFN